jgi:Protein of unknown function (DUF2795)
MSAEPASLERHLEDLDFPAARHHLIAHARKRGADEASLGVLLRLPDIEYQSRIEVENFLGLREGAARVQAPL